MRAIVPPGDGTPEDDFPTRVQSAVFGYVRGQLLFSLIMGTSAGVAAVDPRLARDLPATARPTRSRFGAFFGFAELIPYVGPAIGALPPVLDRAVQPRPARRAVAGRSLFIALQQIEGHIVAPQVFGHALRINPLLVIFALLLGGQIYGFIGAFIALPIAAIAARDGRLPAPPPRARAVAARRPRSRSAGVGHRGARRCPECGAARRAGRGALRAPAGPSWAAPTRPRAAASAGPS